MAACAFVPKSKKAPITSVDATSKDGAFVRKAASFRSTVSADPDAEFPAASGRYILYASYACPWACRCLAVRAMKGLQDAIRVVIVEPVWQRTRPDDENDQHMGWPIAEGADPVFGARSVRDLYTAGSGGTEPTVFSVPVFIDTEKKVVVNNESSEIIRFLNSEFNAFAKHPAVDLFPEPLREEIEKMGEFIYNDINNGVYRCGFAKSQEAYDGAVTDLFNRLDDVEAILSKQRFLAAGSTVPTEADLRLFATIVRFDEVYVVYFKTNKKCIREYPALQGWLRDMYQWDSGVLQSTVNMEHIKNHYYRSHPILNSYGIVPAGPNTLADLVLPHGREGLPAKPE